MYGYKPANKALHIIVFPLRSKAASEFDRYSIKIVPGKLSIKFLFVVKNIEKIQSISIFSSIGCRFTDCTPKASLCRQLILSKKKGAVAFVGSPITAYASAGGQFFKKFWELAALEDCVSLGNAMQNTLSFTNNFRYTFIGDPGLDINR